MISCNVYVAIYIESRAMYIFIMRFLYERVIYSEARNLYRNAHSIYTNAQLLSMHIFEYKKIYKPLCYVENS